MALDKNTVIDVAKGVCPDLEIYEHRDQLSLIVLKENLKEVGKELKENDKTKFIQLVDITAIDWLDKKKIRFEVVYFLYSLEFKSRVRIKVPVDINDITCPSVTEIWESANWYERETYDMYGIKFEGHPNLRRFYMPEDYVDPETGESLHPLRKDFPLMGIPEATPLPPYPEKYGDEDDHEDVNLQEKYF